MMKQFKYYGSWLLIALATVLLIASPVNAKAKAKKQNIPTESKATFMLMPELPGDNLGGDHLGYFNLSMKKQKTREVRLKLFNPTSHSMTVYGQVKNATTNDNGSVDYLGTNRINTQLLPQPGSELVTVPKKTKLQPNETKWLTVKIKRGAQLFKGQKATAINLSAYQFNQNTTIKNHFVYAIGLILNGQKLAKTDYKKIESPKIKTRFVVKKAAISVRIDNPDPTYLTKATIDVTLQNKKWGLIKYQSSRKNRKIAPNSSFYDNLMLGGKRLVPGVYQMTLTVKSAQYQRTIHKYVKITKSDASYINRYNYEYLKNRNLILLGIVCLLVIIGTIVGFRFRRKRDLNAKNGE